MADRSALTTQTQWQLYKDCLGFSPFAFQNGIIRGGYVESDVQFAQLLQDVIRGQEFDSDDTIPSSVYLDLSYRFLLDHSERKVQAAMLQLDWSAQSRALLDDMQDQYQDLGGPDAISPLTHGHNFEDQMYAEVDTISLKNKVISTFYSDEFGRFAGFRTLDTQTQQVEDHTALPVSKLQKHRSPEANDMLLINSYGHTRLVGLRTQKLCDSAQDVVSVQPIYYSVDEQMCTEYLQELTSGMLEEIPAFGITCEEAQTVHMLERVETAISQQIGTAVPKVEVVSRSERIIKELSAVLTWIIFFAVTALLLIEVKNKCQSNERRWRQKTVELKNRESVGGVRRADSNDFQGVPDTARSGSGTR